MLTATRTAMLATTLFAPEPALDCVRARAVPIYEGLGWSHYVEVSNLCDVRVDCLVGSDVDPEPRYRVVLDTGDSELVRTRYGSPTSIYTPIVSCEPTKP